MPNRSSNKDINEIVYSIVEQSTKEAEDQPQKNPTAVALGRLGGLKGGKARAAKCTPEQRQDIARKAAQKRWPK